MPLQGDLDVTVRTDSVAFTFTVTNAGPVPEEVTFPTGCTADFAVFDDGQETWRWSDGQAFTQAIRTATFAPGEESIHEATWDDPTPGDYRAVATLESQSGVRAEAQFTVR